MHLLMAFCFGITVFTKHLTICKQGLFSDFYVRLIAPLFYELFIVTIIVVNAAQLLHRHSNFFSILLQQW